VNTRVTVGAMLCLSLEGCGGDPRELDPTGGIGTGGASLGDTDGGENVDDSDDEGAKLDVSGPDSGDPDSGGGPQICRVVDNQDGVAPCTDTAPPDSFEPAVQWAWEGVDGLDQVVTTPLVANLTDDNGDGVVDLCDVPDVIVNVYRASDEPSAAGDFAGYYGRIAILDGATGQLHNLVDRPILAMHNPALADVDADGTVEIVALEIDDSVAYTDDPALRLVAFHADGSLVFASDWILDSGGNSLGAVAIADLDADGDGEIMVSGAVFDHLGNRLWQGPNRGAGVASAADLDGDGDLEVILGPTAFQHDGTPYFDAPTDIGLSVVADVDGDGLPEVVAVTWYGGMTIIEHDGQLGASSPMPIHGIPRPAAIHDIDGDDIVEILVGSDASFSVFSQSLQPGWTSPTDDTSGASGSTAFDFLGDGSAEAVYADESSLFVYGSTGDTLLTSPRASWTSIEYPVVADVDNDGSAEIVVTSNHGYYGNASPAVQVIRDVEDRWVPARRIWNQHTYHVTNVREDGTLPLVEPRHWEGLNTFRTQAQISAGGVCDPVPAG
jgi:hypothetical protein